MNEIAKCEESTLVIPAELTVEQMVAQVQKIQHLMSSVMKKDEHYGVIPGTEKPSLLQPGAQKLNFVFRLGDRNTQITTTELQNGHREYRVTLDIVHIPTGLVMSQGVGSCSTMESKYRYRNIADYEDTGLPIPADSKERKTEYRKQGFGMKKINGTWAWVHYKDSSRVENPDIADTYNTVLKMANKRAYIHGTIKATAASDLFTQDLEDFGDRKESDGHPEEGEQQQDMMGDNGKKAPGPALLSVRKQYGKALREAVQMLNISPMVRRNLCRKARGYDAAGTAEALRLLREHCAAREKAILDANTAQGKKPAADKAPLDAALKIFGATLEKRNAPPQGELSLTEKGITNHE